MKRIVLTDGASQRARTYLRCPTRNAPVKGITYSRTADHALLGDEERRQTAKEIAGLDEPIRDGLSIAERTNGHANDESRRSSGVDSARVSVPVIEESIGRKEWHRN
jgi:hypothetical protein